MAMTVIDSEGIADEVLPVAEFAAQMRLADGFDAVPGQTDRMRLRLRAALGAVERKLGKALLLRRFDLSGEAPGGRRVPLPIAPVEGVLAVSVVRNGVSVDLGEAHVEDHPHRPVAILPRDVRAGERLRISVQAGYGPWTAVPDALRQAVLLMAEALDAGEGPALTPTVVALISPFRDIRIGGAA